MTAEPKESLRSPETIGYLPWLVYRASAVLLVPLLAIHVGVQVYPTYGFTIVSELGFYQPLLDLTLVLVLVHGFLGVRATVLETRLDNRVTTIIIWSVGFLALGLFVLRLYG